MHELLKLCYNRRIPLYSIESKKSPTEITDKKI